MTLPEYDPDEYEEIEVHDEDDNAPLDKNKRRFLLILQILLLLLILLLGILFCRYLFNPVPLPQIIPNAQFGERCTVPSYKFMIDNIDKPLGVTVSPDQQRIYVSESGGEKFIKMFDRDGNFLTQFAPLGTDKFTRSYVYMATDPAGRLFAVNRESNAIDIFDQDGVYLDSIIRADMTLSKLLLSKGIPLDKLVITRYDFLNNRVLYQVDNGPTQTLLFTLESDQHFSPLGVRFDAEGNLLMTDISEGFHGVAVIPAAALNDLKTFAPEITRFGVEGKGAQEFYFPQTAMKTSQGDYVVSDGNNTRLVKWGADLKTARPFGFGAAEGSIGLPRGLFIDRNDCVLVVDRLNSAVYIYDLFGSEPAFITSFGDLGMLEGNFNYPTDLFIDGTGRLYITDMNNNRVQIWSY